MRNERGTEVMRSGGVPKRPGGIVSRIFGTTELRLEGDLAELWRVRLIEAARLGLTELQILVHARRAGTEAHVDVMTFGNHPGADGIAEDAALNGLFRRYFNEFDLTLYHGEEQPAGLFSWERGLVMVESDPVDGSGPLRNQGAGAAIVLTAWLGRSDHRFQQLAGVILRLDGTMVSWNAQQHFVVVRAPRLTGGIEDRYELHRGEVVPGNPRVVACVGAAGEQLSKLSAIDVDWCTEQGITVYNAAGTPLTASLLLDQTSAIFETTHSKVWDAAGLIPLVLAGGSVYELDGRPYDVLSHMESLNDLSPTARRIRPYVAVSHPDALDTVLRLIEPGASTERAIQHTD